MPYQLSKEDVDGQIIEHDDGSVSVDGTVYLDQGCLFKIPIKFRRVTGSFYCHHSRLISLENAPDFVGGGVWCHTNQLTSLDGLGEVRGEIVCDANLVPEEDLLIDYWKKRAKKDLVGASLTAEKTVDMKYSELPNHLKSWIIGTVTEHEDGSISVDGTIHWGNRRLTKIPIKFRHVSGSFDCGRNGLTSLENAPDFVGGYFRCDDDKLTSLGGLGEVLGNIICEGNPVPEEELLAEYWRKRARKELILF